jgi:hypothetical protein
MIRGCIAKKSWHLRGSLARGFCGGMTTLEAWHQPWGLIASCSRGMGGIRGTFARDDIEPPFVSSYSRECGERGPQHQLLHLPFVGFHLPCCTLRVFKLPRRTLGSSVPTRHFRRVDAHITPIFSHGQTLYWLRPPSGIILLL